MPEVVWESMVHGIRGRPPPPPTIRTVDDEEISASEVSEYSFSYKTKYFIYGTRIFRNSDLPENKEERDRQAKRFDYQLEIFQGFEFNWEEFDFLFLSRSVAWSPQLVEGKTNEELIEYLTQYAIDKHNRESKQATKVVLVEPVMANFFGAAGLVFFITFRGRDELSADPEPKLYQLKVRKFAALIDVAFLRLRPTDEEMISRVDPPPVFVDEETDSDDAETDSDDAETDSDDAEMDSRVDPPPIHDNGSVLVTAKE